MRSYLKSLCEPGPFFNRLLRGALLAAAPAWVALAYLEFVHTQSMQTRVGTTGVAGAQETARITESMLKRMSSTLEFLLTREDITGMDPAKCGPFLKNFYGIDLLLDNVLLIDNNGRLVCAGRTYDGMLRVFNDRAWYHEAVAVGRNHFSKPFREKIENKPVVALTSPVLNAAGNKVGMLMMSLDMARFSHDMLRLEGLPEGSVVAVVDQENTLVARSPDLQSYFGNKVSTQALKGSDDLPEGVDVFQGVDGVTRAYTGAEVSGHPWKAYVGIPYGTVIAMSREAVSWALVVLLATVLASFLVSWRAAKRLAEPVYKLGRVAKALNNGQPVPAEDASLPREFGQLAQDYRDMVVALREANDRFQRIFEMLPVSAALYYRKEGTFRQVNDAFCTVYGLTREQLIGHNLQEYGRGLSPSEFGSYRQQLEEDGCICGRIAQIRVAEDKTRMVLSSAALVTIDDEEYILSVHVDLSDRLAAEAALAQREQQLRGLVENAIDGIVTLDRAGRVIVFNSAASQMFGVAESDMLGESPDSIVPGDLLGAHQAGLARALRGEPMHHHGVLRAIGRRTDGSTFPIEVSLSRAGEGDGITVTAIIRDLTELERGRQAVLERARIEASSQAKTDFLSRMSHELRTPLNAVLGFSTLLGQALTGRVAEDELRQLELINQAGLHLRNLIDDVLDVARIEAGRMTVQLRPVDLCRLADDVLSMHKTEADQAGVRLVREPHWNTALYVNTDPIRLQQVLSNVISNAIKYNRRGGKVQLSAIQEAECIKLVISDTGIGMTAAQLEKVYEPFNRLGRESSSVPGTGIGLALTRELMSLLSGDIHIESVDGEGTAVVLNLPKAEPPAVANTSPANPLPLQQDLSEVEGRVLYIEDVALNAFVVQRLLKDAPGVKLTIAEDAAAGFAAMSEQAPDLLLLDMQLPDKSGLEVIQALRADPKWSHLPIIALSANAMPADVEAARKEGVDDYWTKPIDFNQFRTGVWAWLTGRLKR